MTNPLTFEGSGRASFDETNCQWVAKRLTLAGFDGSHDAKDEIRGHDHGEKKQANDDDGQHGADKKCQPHGDLKVECFFGVLGIKLRFWLGLFDQKHNQRADEASEKAPQMNQDGQGAIVRRL